MLFNTGNVGIISTGLFEHTVSYFTQGGNLINTDNLGGSTFIGCYNSEYNKVYYVKHFSHHNQSYIDIWDGNTNEQIITLPIGSLIKSLCYNEETFKIFVAAENSESLKVIDGNTDQIIYSLSGPAISYLFSYKGKIYAGTDNSIRCYNASDYDSETLSSIRSAHYSHDTDDENDRIFIASEEENKIFIFLYPDNDLDGEITTTTNHR